MGRVFPLLAALLVLIGITWPTTANAHSGHPAAEQHAIAAASDAVPVTTGPAADVAIAVTADRDDDCAGGCCGAANRCCSVIAVLTENVAPRTPFPARASYTGALDDAGVPGPPSVIDQPPAFA